MSQPHRRFASKAFEWVELFDHGTGHTIVCATRHTMGELLTNDGEEHLHADLLSTVRRCDCGLGQCGAQWYVMLPHSVDTVLIFCRGRCSDADYHGIVLDVSKRPLSMSNFDFVDLFSNSVLSGLVPGSKCFSMDEMPNPGTQKGIEKTMVEYATALCIQLCRHPQVSF
jgi:hypothetical protein